MEGPPDPLGIVLGSFWLHFGKVLGVKIDPESKKPVIGKNEAYQSFNEESDETVPLSDDSDTEQPAVDYISCK